MAPKKIHDEFSFDKEIFIDRFVAKNATRFPDFVKSLDKLKRKKQSLEESLKKYQHEGKDLVHFLKVSRKFVEKQFKFEEEGKEDSVVPDDDVDLAEPDQIGTIGMKSSNLKTTISCLKKYEKHLKETVQEEKINLANTINDLGNAYTVLKEYPYSLHCIVIHEGEDNSGHYYSYIKNHIENYWYRYSDHMVKEVSEEQVLGEAYGITKLKTSAYLVMYVSNDKIHNVQDMSSEFEYYLSLIPQDLIDQVNRENVSFNIQLEEAKNKELANDIMEHFKKLDANLKRNVIGNTDKSLLSFPIFCYKNQELILCQHTMLDCSVQEKHPAQLSIDCLDPTLESTLSKAFNRDIIVLIESRKKNLEIFKAAYYQNLEISLLIHYGISYLMESQNDKALKTISYVMAMQSSVPFIQDKILQKKKDILYKHLQIFTCYIISKSNYEIVNDDIEEGINKISLACLLILNYIPSGSSLYSNILELLKDIFSKVQSKLGDAEKQYTRLISSIEKKAITKNNMIGPKLYKNIKTHLESVKSIPLYKWQDEEDEENIYGLYTQTTSSFRMTYQPWYKG